MEFLEKKERAPARSRIFFIVAKRSAGTNLKRVCNRPPSMKVNCLRSNGLFDESSNSQGESI
jgi:hypothetical protein